MKKIILLAFILMYPKAWCQEGYTPIFQKHNQDPYDIPTPNQSDLGTYGIIPVSPYTGKANISIPIFSTSQRGVKLDVNLTYDTSGLLINRLPGWTGHNWTLNAGGAITRKVNGRPDEINYKDTNAGSDAFYQLYKDNVSEITHHIFFTHPELLDQSQYLYRQSYDETTGLSKPCYDGYTGLIVGPYTYPNAYYDEMYCNKVGKMEENEWLTKERYSHYRNYFSSYSENIGKKDVIADLYYDTSADIFYFNFMGISGNFFYGNDGNWKVCSDQNIRVIFDVEDTKNYVEPYETSFSLLFKHPKTIKGFTLIDENGTEYVFGGDKNSIEYSTSLTASVYQNTTEPWTAVSWLLKEVKDRFGNILYTFNYSRGKRIVQMQNSYSNITRTYPYFTNNTQKTRTEKYPNVYNGTINSPVYLDSISMSDGTSITFDHANVYNDTVAFRTLYPNYSFDDLLYMFKSTFPYQDVNPECPYYYEYAQRYLDDLNGAAASSTSNVMKSMNLEELDAIRINYPKTNDKSAIQEVVNFGYDFSNRMHLSSLIFEDSPAKYGYEFTYNQFDKIPTDYLTKEFDYYGYYNGSAYTTDNLYVYPPNAKYGKMGMLNKITYPTRGYSIFDYEQNDYSQFLSENKQNVLNANTNKETGGLRISSIGNYDSNGTLLTKKSYKYTDPNNNNLSSGQLYGSTKTHYAWSEKQDNSNQILQQYTLDVLCSQQPMSNSFAPTIGYLHVIEENLDGSCTSYTYSSCTTEKDELYMCSRPSDAITPFDEFSSRQYMRGKLLRQTIFDKNNDAISCTEYTYTSDDEFNKSNFVATTSFTIHPVFANVGSRYKLFYFKPQIESVVSKTKYGKDWVTDTTTYENKHFLMDLSDAKCDAVDLWKTLSETKSQGESTLKTVYTYPFIDVDLNLPLNASQKHAAHRQLLKDFCIPVIGIQQFHDGILINGLKDFYRMDLVKPVIDYSIAYNSDSTMYNIMRKYISYSQKGEPTMIVDENGVMHNLYWNGFGKLIATAANGELQVNTRNTIDAIINVNSSTIFTSKPIDAKFVEYDPHGNASRITSQNKATSVFEYDQHGRLVQTSVKTADGKKQTVNKYQYKYKGSQK